MADALKALEEGGGEGEDLVQEYQLSDDDDEGMDMLKGQAGRQAVLEDEADGFELESGSEGETDDGEDEDGDAAEIESASDLDDDGEDEDGGSVDGFDSGSDGEGGMEDGEEDEEDKEDEERAPAGELCNFRGARVCRIRGGEVGAACACASTGCA